MDQGTLFVVATPIGNREDLSPRARQVLSQVDLIAAEDTRHTGRLLSHFGINARLLALHDHNEEQQVPVIIDRLRNGESVALVSDAGTPLISDPGYRLLSAAHAAGLTTSPIPGPSAVISALSVAGLPSDAFVFEGFLPAKAQARKARLAALAGERRTLILLESVHKIRSTIPDLVESMGADRAAFVGREMTKLHEQCVHGTLGSLAEMLAEGVLVAKGEFVLIIHGNQNAGDDLPSVAADVLLRELLRELPGSKAADIVSRVTGRKRNDVYREMLSLKDEEAAD